eukprot:c6782_g1_i2.p1 GENE.c6782_g1_i2~~c6782_g1_i2.p1  ORF type:complete len:367 (-),score=101.61 c6782_g1_i2:16-1116(-)
MGVDRRFCTTMFPASALLNMYPTSPIATMVQRASTPSSSGIDWALVMSICDLLNNTPECCNDFAKVCKVRLHHDVQVQLLILTIVDAAVKNCGTRLRAELGTRGFISDLVLVIKEDTSGYVRPRALTLMSEWAQSCSDPPYFQRALHTLESQGYVVPPPRTPRTQNAATPRSSAAGSSSSASPSPAPSPSPSPSSSPPIDAKVKLTKDFEFVKYYTKAFRTFLIDHGTTVSQTDVQDRIKMCQTMHEKLVGLVEKVTTDDVLLSQLLELIDQVNDVLSMAKQLPNRVLDANPHSGSSLQSFESNSNSQLPETGFSEVMHSSRVDTTADTTTAAATATASHVKPTTAAQVFDTDLFGDVTTDKRDPV